MKQVVFILLVIVGLNSCGIVSKVEEPFYHLHDNVDALVVVHREGSDVYFRSAGGMYYYYLNDRKGEYRDKEIYPRRDYLDLFYEVDILYKQPDLLTENR